MRPRRTHWIAPLALLATSACIEHHNELGSLGVGGALSNVGGSAGTGSNDVGGGAGGSGSTLLARCSGNAETLLLSRACRSDEECCPLQDSSETRLEGAASGACVSGVLAIRCDERIRYDSFVSVCPKSVAGCSPSSRMIATEDGRSAAYDVPPAARCEAFVCRSYLP